MAKPTKKTTKPKTSKAKPATKVTESAAADQSTPAAQPVSVSPTSTARPKKNWLVIILGILLFVAFLGLAYGYISTRNQLQDLNASSKSSNEAGKLSNKLSKTTDLPTNETPTMATVKDASKLKNQAFFVNAKNGDRVLIYQNSGRALLYRPSTGKIIEFSHVSLNGDQ